MQTPYEVADRNRIQHCIKHLSVSERGRNSMRHVLNWLDQDGLLLDGDNKNAILILIDLAYRYPGSARDMMREAIE